MKSFISTLFFLCVLFGNAQNEINNFKYVVVPNQFSFLKGKDTYQLNSLTKFLFNRKGFESYLEEDDLPQVLFDDRCKALYAEVEEDNSGFRKTKLKIILRDCLRNIIYESRVGESGNNNYKDAHHEALRDAFVSIDQLDYNYDPQAESSPVFTQSADRTTVPITDDKKVKTSEAAIASSAADKVLKEIKSTPVLTASERPFGYELKDVNGKTEMILLETSAQEVYLVKGRDAIVYREASKWVYSSNDGQLVVKKVLSIKF